MEQNYVFQSYLNLFNYKTYAADKGKYFTANFISVWEKYYPIYGDKSQSETLNMWTEIYYKWVSSFQKKIIRYGDWNKGTLTHHFAEPWGYWFDMYVKRGRLEKNHKYIYSLAAICDMWYENIKPRECYDCLKALYANYLSFIHALNTQLKDIQYNVVESFIKAPVDHSWVESLGRFDIKKYDEKKDRKGYYRGIFKVHPALLDTHLY